MTTMNMMDRITQTVGSAWAEVVPESEYLEWHVSVVTEPTMGNIGGEMVVEMENFVAMWIQTKEPEEDLTMNGRVAIRISNATDENLRDLVKNTWDAIMLERMETQFQE